MNVLSVRRRFYDINIYRGTGRRRAFRNNRTSGVSILLLIFHRDKPINREDRK